MGTGAGGRSAGPAPGGGAAGPVRVLLVDDNRLVRAALEQLLEQVPEIEVVGSAGGGAQALVLVASARPDVVLTDLAMPEMDGVEATREIRTAFPGVNVVALTAHADAERVLATLRAGAVGYVLKDGDPDELVSAIKAAARGEAWLSPRAVNALRAARPDL